MLDLDGTISEMVPRPEDATVSSEIRATLELVHQRLALVAIVTGRPARQAMEIVGLPGLVYSGNHGLERLEKGDLTLAPEVRSFVPELHDLLSRLQRRFPSPGLVWEDKVGSFAVHYRLEQQPERARAGLLAAIRELAAERVRLVMGKAVINVLPPLELTKGTAVTALAGEFDLDAAILIGDDVTDLDAFRAVRRMSAGPGLRGVSIAVLGEGTPSGLEDEVEFVLDGVSQVGDFLSWLAEEAAR